MKFDYTYSDLSFRVCVVFEPRDLWLGVYIAKPEPKMPWKRRVYLCLVPMLPIVLSWNPRVRL